MQLCEEPKLVVFDNYENIDNERCEIFTKVIDSFLQFGCEIIVCSSPYNDSILKFQTDAFILTANDLVLNDDELSYRKETLINRIPVVA